MHRQARQVQCVGLVEIGSYELIRRFPGPVVRFGGNMYPHGGLIVVRPAAGTYVVNRERTSGKELVYIAVLALLGFLSASEPHRESHVRSMA